MQEGVEAFGLAWLESQFRPGIGIADSNAAGNGAGQAGLREGVILHSISTVNPPRARKPMIEPFGQFPGRRGSRSISSGVESNSIWVITAGMPPRHGSPPIS